MAKQTNWHRVKQDERIYRYGAEASSPRDPGSISYQHGRPSRRQRPNIARKKAQPSMTPIERSAQWMDRANKALTYNDRIRAIRFVHRARIAIDIDGTGRTVSDTLAS